MKKNITFAAILCVGLAVTSCGSSRKVHGCDYPDLKENSEIHVSGLEISRSDSGMEASRGGDDLDQQYLILSDAQQRLVRDNNRFALNLFGKLSGHDSKVVSPLSVTWLMAMLANGACGETRREIMETIGADSVSVAEMNDFYHCLSEYLQKADKSVTLNIANYIALNNRFRLQDAFSRTLMAKYGAGIERLDFSSQKAVDIINCWCKEHTGGMIPEVIDGLEPSAVSCVLNAIFFNGAWQDKFDKKETRLERFQGYTRDIKRVQMMHRNDKMLYIDNDTYAAVNLPYGKGNYSMTVLLPNAGKGIGEVVGKMGVGELENMRRKMDECYVDLKLPRFTTEVDLTLNDIIGKLGAPTMFTSGADFSSFADGDLHVSKMFQKAKIEVNEEGTKAAAVTGAVVALAMLEPNEPRHVEFHADRPFVYIITESTTGAILFIGQFTGSEI